MTGIQTKFFLEFQSIRYPISMDKQGPLLSLTDLSCGYQKQPIVQDLSLHLNSGDIGCLLGPSGCGKTTTLRAIAGFEPIIKGTIRLAGEVISRPNFTLAPENAASVCFPRLRALSTPQR